MNMKILLLLLFFSFNAFPDNATQTKAAVLKALNTEGWTLDATRFLDDLLIADHPSSRKQFRIMRFSILAIDYSTNQIERSEDSSYPAFFETVLSTFGSPADEVVPMLGTWVE